MVCAFSGHRPEKLPWGTRDDDPHCQALQTRLRQTVAELAEQGYDTFLCGMARGCDRYFFEAVRYVRLSRPELRLVAVIPCASQARAWPLQEQLRYGAALAECDEVQVLSEHYFQGCMIVRNHHMIDHAQLLLTVWDGSSGGTASAVAYARRKGVPIRAIWR